LRAVVQQDASASRLESLGLERGMRLLKEDGIRVVRQGLTTVEEVLRVANV
jgi:general secretion pathway protein E